MRLTLAVFVAFAATAAAEPARFGLPVACQVGETCFIQQFVDMDGGPGASDPACGPATYDGHDGTDFRVRTMADADRGVPVMAAADGTVLRARDGELDQLASTDQDRRRIAERECGNGLVIDHGGGWETQYCHLKRGSLVVGPGDRVAAAQPVGEIGASGLVQFPHVHLTIRQDGTVLDPFTGRPAGAGCGGEANPLWTETAAAQVSREATALLDMGLASGPVTSDELVQGLPPSFPAADAPAMVLWAWAINLQKGDRIALRLESPDGVIADSVTEPLNRSKADYVAFAGRRHARGSGPLRGSVALLRDGKPVLKRERIFGRP